MDIRPGVLQCLKDDLDNLLREDMIPILFSQDELSTSEFSATYLYRNLFRRYEGITTKPSKAAITAAEDAYLEANNSCKDWKYDPQDLFEEYLMGTFRSILGRFIDSTIELVERRNRGFLSIWDEGKLGPGSNQGCASTSFYEKMYSSTLTVSGKYSLQLLQSVKIWDGLSLTRACAESLRSREFGERIVRGPRCTAVHKTVDKARLVFTQPSVNMLAQQGFATFLRYRLASEFGIDLTSQQVVNGVLAEVGSLTGEIATIDMKSASDSIPKRMLQWALTSYGYAFLERFCDEEAFIRNKWMKVHCFSTQGNAVTFPLQTAVFACAVQACRTVLSKPFEKAGRRWSVFGDDVICETDVYFAMCKLLRAIGSRINVDKSFVYGTFRESCGQDFYRGQAVRPIHIKNLETEDGRFVAINTLREWERRHAIPLTKTLKFLTEKVRYFPVPLWEQDDAGIRVSWADAKYSRKVKLRRGGEICYTRLELCKHLIVFGEEGASIPPNHKQRFILNEAGILLCKLGGYIKDSQISLRHRGEERLYKAVRSSTRLWDNPSAYDEFGQRRTLPFRRVSVTTVRS